MRKTLAVLLAALFFAAGVTADDVTDQIDEGKAAYAKGDTRTAITALEAALTLIRQGRAEQLGKFLPNPLAGWNANEISVSQAGMAFLGGGLMAERTYTKTPAEGKAEGDEGSYAPLGEVKITLTQDSPLLQALSMAIGNSMLLGPGQKLIVISGQKAIVDNEGRTIQAMVGEKILVSAEGNESVSADDVKNYFKAMDFAGLEAASKK